MAEKSDENEKNKQKVNSNKDLYHSLYIQHNKRLLKSAKLAAQTVRTYAMPIQPVLNATREQQQILSNTVFTLPHLIDKNILDSITRDYQAILQHLKLNKPIKLKKLLESSTHLLKILNDNDLFNQDLLSRKSKRQTY